MGEISLFLPVISVVCWMILFEPFGSFSGIGTAKNFSEGFFVSSQGGQVPRDQDVEGFGSCIEGSFICFCSFFILLWQSLIRGLIFNSSGIRFPFVQCSVEYYLEVRLSVWELSVLHHSPNH